MAGGSTGAASSGGSSGLNGSSSGGSSSGNGLTGTVTRIAGNGDRSPDGGLCEFECYQDGPGDQAMFQQVGGLAIVGRTLYVADTLNEVIRAVDLSSAPAYTVSTLAGNPALAATTQDGVGTSATFFLPKQPMAYQGMLLVGTGMNVRQITLPGAVVTTLAGPDTGNKASENSNFPIPFSAAYFNDVTGLAVDPSTGLIYAVDEGSGYVHELDPVAQEDYYLAGAGKLAAFEDPVSAVVLNGGLFITDSADNYIRRVSLPDAGSPSVTNVAGNGGEGFSDSSAPGGATFDSPQGMCTDGQTIYIVDQNNKAIRQMDPVSYEVTTLVGGPDAGIFDNPYDCAWDPVAGALYVSDDSYPAATPDGVGNVIYMVQ